MKALKCEMCGGNDLVKKGDLYVCENCGTKYDTEAAKKLFVEVEMSGSVKIDYTDEIENWRVLARRGVETGELKDAYVFYSQILDKSAYDIEALFYKKFVVEKYEVSLISTIDPKVNDFCNVVNKLEDSEVEPKLANVYELIRVYCEYLNEKRKSVSSMIDMQPSQLSTHIWIITFKFTEKIEKSLGHKEFLISCLKKIVNVYGSVDENNNFVKDGELEPTAILKTLEDFGETTNYTRGGCYIATSIYGSYDCPEVWTLRRYRDNNLATTWYGRLFIYTYYAVSPIIVKWFGDTYAFKKIFKGRLDQFVNKLQNEGFESTPYSDTKWR